MFYFTILEAGFESSTRKVAPKLLSVHNVLKEEASRIRNENDVEQVEVKQKQEKRFSGKFAGMEDILARNEQMRGKLNYNSKSQIKALLYSFNKK